MALAEEIGAEVMHVPSRSCDLSTVQDIAYKCHMAPMFGAKGFHLVLVDEADTMSRASQHAFLSLLDSTGFPPQSAFVFTCNSTASLEDRFLSRCRVVHFTTDGLREPGVALLSRIWKAEMRKASAPDFEAILTAAKYNIRESLMILETEMLAPGTFKVPQPPTVQVIHAVQPSSDGKIVDPVRRAAALKAWDTMRARRAAGA